MLPGCSLVTRCHLLSKHSYHSLTLIIISSFTAREHFSPLSYNSHNPPQTSMCVFYYILTEEGSSTFFYDDFKDVIRSFINLSVSTSVLNWFSSCHSVQNEQIKSVFLHNLCTVCMLTPWWHSLTFHIKFCWLEQHWHTPRWVVIRVHALK